MAIAEDPTVSSESIGDAFMKTVIISARRNRSTSRGPCARARERHVFARRHHRRHRDPAGRGGIGVVRISGPWRSRRRRGASSIRDAPLEPRHATFTRVRARRDDADRPVDEVVATWFPAPHSYTGEHVVEISAHGSPVDAAADRASAIDAGARLARPGEFTLARIPQRQASISSRRKPSRI